MIASKAQHTPMQEKVRVLQRKLYLSAKEQPKKKYGILYDKLHRWDILKLAWKQVRMNKGSAGIDNQSVDYIVDFIGVDPFLQEIQQELRDKVYRPKPVKRVYISKENRKKRPLGIPVIKDRIVQTAVKIVMEPIFEADFHECSYGFRPKRNQHQAIRKVRRHIVTGHRYIIDLDLKSYFDTIPHENLIALVRERVTDPWVIRLIRRWLKAGVIENDVFQTSEKGSPQGGVISPLLANIYLNAFDQFWHKKGLDQGKHQAKLVRFADDSVICCRHNPKRYLTAVRQIMRRLGLTINEDKTSVIHAKEGFDFLGFHFRYKKSRTGKFWCYMWPSQRSMKRIRKRVKQALRIDIRTPISELASIINSILKGWCNYYRWSNAAVHFIQMDRYVQERITRLLRRKRQKRGNAHRDYRTHFFRGIGIFFLSGNVKRLPF